MVQRDIQDSGRQLRIICVHAAAPTAATIHLSFFGHVLSSFWTMTPCCKLALFRKRNRSFHVHNS